MNTSRKFDSRLEKCRFYIPELDFMGHVLSARGIGPMKSKVEEVSNARRPDSVLEVRFSRAIELLRKGYP